MIARGMRTLDFSLPSDRIFLTSSKGEDFIPLGPARADALSEHAIDRILGNTAERDPDIWGTLGMVHPADAGDPAYTRPFAMSAWTGRLHFSGTGSDHSTD